MIRYARDMWFGITNLCVRGSSSQTRVLTQSACVVRILFTIKQAFTAGSFRFIENRDVTASSHHSAIERALRVFDQTSTIVCSLIMHLVSRASAEYGCHVRVGVRRLRSFACWRTPAES